MIEENESKLYISVIRRGMGIEDRLLTLTEEDYTKLVRFGKRQDILPIVFNGVKDLDIDEEWKAELKGLCIKDKYKFAVKESSLDQIKQGLNDSKVPFILLKGAALCELYPEKWMRTSRDIDILVHESDLPQALEAIERNTNFKKIKRNYHDIEMRDGRSVLELHFNIMEAMDNLDSLLKRVWEYSKTTGRGFEYCLVPEYQIFHIIAHISYHMINGGAGIRNIIDLWLLRNKTEYSEEIVRKYCSECNILKFYDVCSALSEVWFGKKLHTEETLLLEEYCINGGVFGSAIRAMAGRQRENKRYKYIMHRLFIKKTVLEEMYPLLREKPYLLVFYYIRRLLRLMNKTYRMKALREAKAAISSNDEEILSYDTFLKRVGL